MGGIKFVIMLMKIRKNNIVVYTVRIMIIAHKIQKNY